MNCPNCDHPTGTHDVGCFYNEWCSCSLTDAEALVAAQRHAAAVRLLEIRIKLNFAWKRMLSGESATEWHEIRAKRNVYQLALRDTGIQRKLTYPKP